MTLDVKDTGQRLVMGERRYQVRLSPAGRVVGAVNAQNYDQALQKAEELVLNLIEEAARALQPT